MPVSVLWSNRPATTTPRRDLGGIFRDAPICTRTRAAVVAPAADLVAAPARLRSLQNCWRQERAIHENLPPERSGPPAGGES
jgi:hypothetical protein